MFTGIFTEPDARLHVQWVNEAQVEGIGEQVYFKKGREKIWEKEEGADLHSEAAIKNGLTDVVAI